MIDVRGWGYLTGGGSGALGLDADTASRLQDELGRLIASAPDLLEACQEALTYCEHLKSSMFGVEPSHADQLRAAIRKATGEAS